MALNELLTQAKGLTLWLDQHTNEKNVPNTLRATTGLAILQLSMDIADAIVVLVETSLPGPAFALARPMFESYVRSVWLLHYASEAEIKNFNRGKCPKFPMLLTAIGADHETGGAWIHVNNDANIVAFHDLTHGGSEHVKRRISVDAVEPRYPEQELEALLRFGIELRIRIGTELLSLMGCEAALQVLDQKARDFRGQ